MNDSEHDPSGQELMPPVDDLIDLERARIDNANRLVDVRRELIAAGDRNDQRHFEFHTNRLEREMAFHHTRHKTYKTVVYAVIIATVATVCFLFYNAFYGEGRQQEYALMIIKYLAIGLAGYGVISGIAGLFRRLMKPDAE
ncbi:MAG: hypothetical protein OXU62_11835 [Gammaproteobacteria bacterium]|nr:hypothetical protein [Gammaproteobacteria bacterium]